MSRPHIGGVGGGEQNEAGHVIVVIEQDMGFDAAFDFLETGPGKQTQAQRNRGGVQGQQFVFEPKRRRPGAEQLLLSKPMERGPEQLFKQS